MLIRGTPLVTDPGAAWLMIDILLLQGQMLCERQHTQAPLHDLLEYLWGVHAVGSVTEKTLCY